MASDDELDIIFWQDIVLDGEVSELVVGSDITVGGVGVFPRGHPLQKLATGSGTVEWSRWDGLNRILWTAIRTEAQLLLAMDTLVVPPAQLPEVGAVTEYAGYLSVLYGYMIDDLDPSGWEALRSTWTVHAVQQTRFEHDYLVQATPATVA